MAPDHLGQLGHIEAIKRLKARYCRLMDEKRWPEFAELFTDDAVLTSGSGDSVLSIEGGGAGIAATLSGRLDGIRTAHHATGPDIEIIDDAHARGSWSAFFVQGGGRLTGYGFYDDEYRCIDGRWLIQHGHVHTTWAEGSAVPPHFR